MAMYDRESGDCASVRERSALAGFDTMTTDDVRATGRPIRFGRVRRRGRAGLSICPCSIETGSSRFTTFDDRRPRPNSQRPPPSHSFRARGFATATSMTVFAWGAQAGVSGAAGAGSASVSASRQTRRSWRAATGSRSARRARPLVVAARPRRIERRALHAWPRRQGLAARLERRPAQPAQLRRHRTPDARALPLRPDRRSARGHARAGRTSTGSRRVGDRRLLARRQSGRETGRRAGRRARSARPRGGGGEPDDRSRAMRPRDRAARPTIPISGTSCGTCATGCDARRGAWPGAFDLAPLDRIWTIRRVRRRRTRRRITASQGRLDYYYRRPARCAWPIGFAFRR